MARRSRQRTFSATALSLLVAVTSLLQQGAGTRVAAAETWPRRLILWTEFRGDLYFTGVDDKHGRELWKSDGTRNGTFVLKDINTTDSELPDAFPRRILWDRFAVVGRKLFFVADDGIHGEALWVTNGTRSGTRMVKDIARSDSSVIHSLTALGDRLFFVYENPKEMGRLWKSDGTAAGTVRVKSEVESPKDPMYLYAWKNNLFFSADGLGIGRELWKSNGKAAGTKPVRDIRKNASDHILSSYPSTFAGGDTILYFVANDGGYRFNNTGIWKTDGTAKGTHYVKNVDEKRGYWDDPPEPSYLTTIGDRLFFADNDCDHGWELWTSDGTTEGTVLIEIRSGLDLQDCDEGSHPYAFQVFQQKVFFSIHYDPTSNHDALWMSQGTTETTEKVTHFPSTDYEWTAMDKTVVGDTLFFEVVDPTPGVPKQRSELWKSDGTTSGTGEIDPSVDNAQDLTAVGDLLFFDSGGLWISDGTALGTKPIFRSDP